MDKVIYLENVTRNYKSVEGVLKRKTVTVKAVKPLNFHVNRGEIFGLLGPNGAGKTTTIKMMTTLLTPSSGTLEILGMNCVNGEKKIRPRINFVFGGERNLYWRLSAYDNLQFFSDLYLIPKSKQSEKITEVLGQVGLSEMKNRKVESFSKGMKQRLQIAKALLNEPEILFLDEPTIGLDPVGARDLRKIIRDIATKNTTVVLTTHYMPEAEELCDRIAIISSGEIVALDHVEGLRKMINEPAKIRIPSNNLSKEDLTLIKNNSAVRKIKKLDKSNFTDIYTMEPDSVMTDIIHTLGREKIRGIQLQDVSLEDIYIELVGDSHVI